MHQVPKASGRSRGPWKPRARGLTRVGLVGETEPVNEDELAAYAAWAQTLSPAELNAHIMLLEARESVAEEDLADVKWQLGMHRAFADTEPPAEPD